MSPPRSPDLMPRLWRPTDSQAASSRVVVITGGTAGVGRACARTFAERGYDVAVLARGEEGLAATLRDVEDRGVRGLALDVDVADAQAVEHAAERIERELGPIDVWVNNAMTSVFARFKDVRPEELERVTDVTYHGTAYGTMAALRRMSERDRGVIVQVGSALAHRSIPLQSAYCGAKHAIVGLTDSIRSELIHDGSRVRITAVHLPAINTPQFRIGGTGWARPSRAQVTRSGSRPAGLARRGRGSGLLRPPRDVAARSA